MAQPLRFSSRGRHGEFQLVAAPVLRCTDAEPTLALLRGAVAEPGVLAAFRRALAAEYGDVARWSEAEVLTRIARLLTEGRWHIAHTPGGDPRFHPGLANRRPEPRAVEPRARKTTAPDQETYVLAVEIKTIGGTLLVNHPVRVIDPDTGDIIVDDLDTDGRGVVRTRVPEDKTYRIEILDEVWDSPDHEFHSDDGLAVLACRFVDEQGVPMADSLVGVKHEDREFELHTDADGRIEAPAAAGPYELRLRGEVFHAHTVLPADVEADDDGDAVHYLFVVPAEVDDSASAGTEMEDLHRLERDAWLDDDDAWTSSLDEVA